ncbi:MAG: SDR family NAD(P)-dependent oxidoreductase, partial [Thiolinea sp.]
MLNNRVAIVTGGLQGIGLAIVKALHQQGARVAVGARRGADPIASAEAKQIVGDQGMVAALDVRSTDSVNSFVAEVTAQLGICDILVNAAGISVHHIVSGHSDVDWEAVIDTNLNGPFRMIRACIDPMKAAGWGRIVNIASTAARTAEPTHAAYCASKSGLVGLTRAVALEG